MRKRMQNWYHLYRNNLLLTLFPFFHLHAGYVIVTYIETDKFEQFVYNYLVISLLSYSFNKYSRNTKLLQKCVIGSFSRSNVVRLIAHERVFSQLIDGFSNFSRKYSLWERGYDWCFSFSKLKSDWVIPSSS